MSDPVIYKNITATVRSPRCAVLINEKSQYWMAAAGGVIEQASATWGGRHFLIIPTDGQRIQEKFWEILEAYSPDHLAKYTLSFADLEEGAPELFTRTKDAYRQSYEKQNHSMDFEEWFDGSARQSTLDELNISDELEAELTQRLSPFHMGTGNTVDWLSKNVGFGFPFTRVTKILPFATRHIGQVLLPGAISDPATALFVNSQTGKAGAEYVNELTSQGFSVTALGPEERASSILRLAFGERRRGDENYLARMPFGLSMLHLGEYYDLRVHREEKEPLVIILGDTVDDFCLYYSLSRMHNRVCWMPLAWLKSCYGAISRRRRRTEDEPASELSVQQAAARELVNLFDQLIDYGHSMKRIQLTSLSLKPRQLIAYRSQMVRISFAQQRLAAHVDCVSPDQISTECTLSVFEENNYTNHRSVVFKDNETVSPFDTPKPKNFSVVRPDGHRWVTSLSIEGYQPSPLPALGAKIVSLQGPTESRVARDGIAYNCPNIAYFGGDIDVVLVRPKIRMLDEMEMLGAFFESIGVSLRYSDKGNYFNDTLRRFGGLSLAGEFVKNPRTRGVLDAFIAKKPAADGSIVYLANDQRAYLTLSAIQKCMDDDENVAVDLVDKLVGQEVLQRGYILQCQRCRLSSWYSLNVLTATFTCNRCSAEQQFTRTHWRTPAEPRWYYKLAETVYQFYENNSHLTLQTLYNLKSRAKTAFHYVPEVDLIDFPAVGEKRELDVACIVDGRVVVGECKTESLRVKDVSKFETLNARLKKRPDLIVFATSLTTVSDEFRNRASGLPKSEILTFPDLYTA